MVEDAEFYGTFIFLYDVSIPDTIKWGCPWLLRDIPILCHGRLSEYFIYPLTLRISPTFTGMVIDICGHADITMP